MKILLTGLMTALFLFCMNACGGENSGSSDGVAQQSSEVLQIDLSFVTIKEGEKLELDTPEKFIELAVLYNVEQRKWTSQLANETNMETYLSAKKAEFFKKYGVSEKQFEQYSIANMNAIGVLLDKNPAYKKGYYDSLKLLESSDVNTGQQ